jgi:hypothetical protein
MKGKILRTITVRSFVLIIMLGAAWQAASARCQSIVSHNGPD